MSSTFQSTGQIDAPTNPSASASDALIFGNSTDPVYNNLLTSGSKIIISGVTIQGSNSDQTSTLGMISLPTTTAAAWSIEITTKSWGNTTSAGAVYTVMKSPSGSGWNTIYGMTFSSDYTRLNPLEISLNEPGFEIGLEQVGAATDDGVTYHSVKFEFSSGNDSLIVFPIFN
jgi:hypothetical protein